MKTLAFIDAANLFYGGEKSLGWKIDYKKLIKYLKEKYQIKIAYYFGGVEIHKLSYNYLTEDTVSLKKLEKYLVHLIKNQIKPLNEAQLVLLSRHLQRIRFYLKLQQFGYQLILKPVKLYYQHDGETKRKANCDVDMAFYLVREKDRFDRALILSGDGDFLPVLKYLKQEGKEILVLARGPRTAREIRQFAGGNFRDFEYLKFRLTREEK